MSTKIIDIESNLKHKVSEVICIKCKYRWIATRPVVTKLKFLECPVCHNYGFVIETGEELTDE